MKDIKQIRQDFYLAPWIMPQGGQKKFFSEIQPELMCELLSQMKHAMAQFFSNIIKSQLLSQ